MAGEVAASGGVGVYCRGCGYDLRGSEGRCPECGRGFDRGRRRSYLRRAGAFGRRRWVRRVIIGLLIVIVPLAPVAGGAWWLRRGWEAEQEHILHLQGRGVQTRVGMVRRSRTYASVAVTPRYAWVHRWLPADWKRYTERADRVDWYQGDEAELRHVGALSELRSLYFVNGWASDAGLAHLSRLRRLEMLIIWREGSYTDGGMGHLAGLTEMRQLRLMSQTLSGAGLRHLSGMTKMEELTILGSERIDGAAMAHLAGMTAMRHLVLEGSGVTDEGLRHLAGMTGLVDLELTGARVTGPGLVHLTGLTALKNLSLAETIVGDEGIEHIARMSGLVTLRLSGTRVTDRGLELLHSMRGLRELRVNRTETTAEGVWRLREALGGTRVIAS